MDMRVHRRIREMAGSEHPAEVRGGFTLVARKIAGKSETGAGVEKAVFRCLY